MALPRFDSAPGALGFLRSRSQVCQNKGAMSSLNLDTETSGHRLFKGDPTLWVPGLLSGSGHIRIVISSLVIASCSLQGQSDPLDRRLFWILTVIEC